MHKLLDPTDIRILNILQQDARLGIKQIAGLVHKSTSPTHERIRKLHDQGFIKRYMAVLDREKIGRRTLALAQVIMADHSHQAHECFVAAVNAMPEVTFCLQVSGACDYLLHVSVPGPENYQDFLEEKLFPVPGVKTVQTSFVLSECKAHIPYLL